MTYVSKEFEIKKKMEQEQWLQQKMLFLLVKYFEIFIQWGDWLLMVRGGVVMDKKLVWLRGMNKFLAGVGEFPPSSQQGKLSTNCNNNIYPRVILNFILYTKDYFEVVSRWYITSRFGILSLL